MLIRLVQLSCVGLMRPSVSHRFKPQALQHGIALWDSILICDPLGSATYSLQLSLLDSAVGYLLIDQMFPHNLLYFCPSKLQ